jgi:hypothetical protein
MVNLLEETDKFRPVLQQFYVCLRRKPQGRDLEEAEQRLRALVRTTEPLVSNHAQRFTLTMDQRWGYVQLYSLVETARRELARLSRESEIDLGTRHTIPAQDEWD